METHVDTANTQTGTYRHTKSQIHKVTDTRCSHAQTPGHPLTQMPEFPLCVPAASLPPPACLGCSPRLPHFARSLPPPQARLSPSSCRPRSSHQAELLPRSPSPSLSQPLCFGLLSASHCPLCLSISPSGLCISRSRPSPSGSLLISRSLSAVSSSLIGLYFSHGLSIPFHLSLCLSWVENLGWGLRALSQAPFLIPKRQEEWSELSSCLFGSSCSLTRFLAAAATLQALSSPDGFPKLGHPLSPAPAQASSCGLRRQRTGG